MSERNIPSLLDEALVLERDSADGSVERLLAGVCCWVDVSVLCVLLVLLAASALVGVVVVVAFVGSLVSVLVV